jgi:hypothetical protein
MQEMAENRQLSSSTHAIDAEAAKADSLRRLGTPENELIQKAC